MSTQKEIKSLCGLCPWACGIIVSLEDEKIVKIIGDPDHPWNHGKLCPKAAGIMDYVYSPLRVKYPMKKVNGKFERISWDEALDIMAMHLNKIKDNYGAKSWAVLEGMSFVCQGFTSMGLVQRFCDVYGSPNFITPESMCYLSGITANMLTLGKFPAADPENSKCIILWGHNPTDSNFITAEHIMDAKKKGATLIVVDPRKTSLAKKADIHAQIRPGTDCALALSMLNIIISENLYDKEFVEKWTTGFDELAEHVKAYSPQKIEKITLVPEKVIRDIAHSYAAIKPACIVEGINTLQQVPSGFQNQRAILILQSVTGNIDVAGGTVAVDLGGIGIPSVANCSSLRLPEMVKEPSMGKEQFPLLVEGGWTAQGMLLPDMVLTGKPYPIKGLAVIGSNPLLTWPNTNKMRRALEKLDFLAVILTTMNETAELADLILPEASFLERTEIWEILSISFNKPFINVRNKVIDFYESLPDPEIWIKLAKRMGYEKYFPWKDMNELLEYAYGPTGLDFTNIFGKTNCIPYGEIKYKQYEREGFKTPSGKVEISSSVMKQLGLDPLPVFKEPPESPLSSPELAKEYPVILTTGSRKLQYSHSSFREIEKFKKRMPEPYGEIHPETAKLYGITDEDLMTVETKRGKIEIKAKITEDILQNILSIPHGWVKSNVNILTDEKTVDPVTGYPSLKALLCRIRSKNEKADCSIDESDTAATGSLGSPPPGLTGMIYSTKTGEKSKKPVSSKTDPILPVNEPNKWDDEADIVVVGGGGAGLAAALRAAQKGASVILTEMGAETGGATQHATGAICFGSRAQKRIKGLNLPPMETIYNMAMAGSSYSINPYLLRSILYKGAETMDWIEDLGIEWEVMTLWNMPNCHVPKGTLNKHWLMAQKDVTDLLLKLGREMGVKYMLKAHASALVRKDNRITGLKARRSGEYIYLKAKKGVILAAGGISNNRELLKIYIPQAYTGCGASMDMPSAMGSVFRMGLGAGADIAGVNSISIFDGGIPYFEKTGSFYRYLYSGDVQLSRQPWLFINKRCERFINEDPAVLQMGFISKGAAIMSQPGGRAYVIFDNDYEKNIGIFKGEFCEHALTPDLPGMDEWNESICPKDWRIAVKKAIDLGMIQADPTIEGLAGKLELDPVRFKERVTSYNKMCEAGADHEFGKKTEFLIPIKNSPFYGIKVGSNIGASQCGLRVNENFQVLDINCSAIPGLYAAFHTAGGAIGENIMGASVLADCHLAYTSGYVAGETAASKG